MGMYTEFIFGCTLSKDTPKVCLDALDYVINGEEGHIYDRWNNETKTQETLKYERTTPQNEIDAFIDEYDLYRLFCCSSFYFGVFEPVHKFLYDHIADAYMISTRANCKNYTGQIEKFIEYIKPYVESGAGFPHEIFAYVQYEESEFPTVYGTDGVYHIDDPEVTKQCKKSLEKRWSLLERLFKELCPNYSITDEELAEHNIKPEDLTYEDSWELMIDHLIKTYKKSDE